MCNTSGLIHIKLILISALNKVLMCLYRPFIFVTDDVPYVSANQEITTVLAVCFNDFREQCSQTVVAVSSCYLNTSLCEVVVLL